MREALLQGEQLAREGKLPGAAAAYEKALAIAPALVPVHVSLISVYGRLGQAARAEEHFRAAIALKPDEPEAHFNHGLLLASREKFRLRRARTTIERQSPRQENAVNSKMEPLKSGESLLLQRGV